MNRRHDDDSILSFLARGVRRVRALAVPAVRSAGHPHADDSRIECFPFSSRRKKYCGIFCTVYNGGLTK